MSMVGTTVLCMDYRTATIGNVITDVEYRNTILCYFTNSWNNVIIFRDNVNHVSCQEKTLSIH